MKTTRLLMTIISMLAIASMASASSVREPAVAGAFYPEYKNELETLVRGYLDAVPAKQLQEVPTIIIVPHAGYVYSGPVAAYAFKEIEGQRFDTVIVLGFSHRVGFPGVAVCGDDFYRTPLGDVPVNKAFVTALKAQDAIFVDYPKADAKEHSLEVEVPFLQMTVPDLTVVPLTMGDMSPAMAERVATALAAVMKDKHVLVVASTDLSHYKPYNDAVVADRVTVDTIATLSVEKCLAAVQGGTIDACGTGPIMVSVLLARSLGFTGSTVLKYANSGDTAGDKNRVVGYAAIAITGKESEAGMAQKNTDDERLLSDEGRKTLLAIARETLTQYLATKQKPAYTVTVPELTANNGAFVTLHKKGQLRGCIGCFVSDKPLYLTIQEFVLNSALNDPRFPPVTAGEVKDLDIEISVLSPMRRIQSADELVLGKHGVYIKKGFRAGTFLPQVATETGWTKDEFLGHCAQDKAGIGWDGWKTAELYVYTAEVFGEKEQ